MQSQLGMILPFFHKKDGGQIKQAAHPTAVPAYPGAGTPLKYFCTKCQQYVEPQDVTEDADYKVPIEVGFGALPPGQPTSLVPDPGQPTGAVKLNPPAKAGT